MNRQDTEYLVTRYREIKSDIKKIDEKIEYLRYKRDVLSETIDNISKQLINEIYPIDKK